MSSGLPLVGAQAILQNIDQFLNDAGRFDSAMVGMNKAAAESGKGAAQSAADSAKLSAAWRELGDAAGKLGGYLTAAGAALTGISTAITLSAARYEELGIALNVTGKNANYTESQLIGFQGALEKTGISMAGSREFMIRLMQSEIDLGRATELARAAQDLAVIGMSNSTETANDLAYAISSLNVRLLRKYGIVGDITEIMEWYGKSLGYTGDALKEFTSESDRTIQKQAMLEFILKEAGKFTGVYEAAMGSASKQIRSMDRYVADLAVEFGNALLPALTAVVFAVKDFLSWMKQLDEETKATIATVTAIVGVLTLLGGTTLLLIPQIVKFGQAVGTIISVLGTLGAALGPILLVFGAVAAVVGVVGYAFVNSAIQSERMRQAANELNETYEKQLQLLHALDPSKYLPAITAETHALALGYQERKKAQDAERALREERDKGVQSRIAEIRASEELTDAEKESLIAIQMETFGVKDAGEANLDFAASAYETERAAKAMGAETNRLTGLAQMYAGAQAAANAETQRMTGFTDESARAIAEVLGLGGDFVSTLLKEAASADEAASKVLFLANALRQAAAANLEMIGSTAQTMVDFGYMNMEIADDIANYYAEAESSAGGSMDSLAQRQKQMADEMAENARRMALTVKYWTQDQYEFIADMTANISDTMTDEEIANAQAVTESLKAEFSARTAAVAAEADKIKETNAALAQELLEAESQYQQEKLAIMTDPKLTEEERTARLAILERENTERIERAKETAALEEQIRAEQFKREIEQARVTGAVSGTAMADAFMEKFKKISGDVEGLYDDLTKAAEEGIVLPQETIDNFVGQLNALRRIIQTAPIPEDIRQGLMAQLTESFRLLEEMTTKAAEAAGKVGTAGQTAGGQASESFKNAAKDIYGFEIALGSGRLSAEQLAAASQGVATEWKDDEAIAATAVEDHGKAMIASRDKAKELQEKAAAVRLSWSTEMALAVTTVEGLKTTLETLTTSPYVVHIDFDYTLPEWMQPDSPKSKLQVRMEALKAWADANTIVFTVETDYEYEDEGYEGGAAGVEGAGGKVPRRKRRRKRRPGPIEEGKGGGIYEPYPEIPEPPGERRWLSYLPKEWAKFAGTISDLMSMASSLSSAGGYFADRIQKEQVDPMLDRLEELNAELKVAQENLEGTWDPWDRAVAEAKVNGLLEERDMIMVALEEKQRKILEYQEAAQKLEFLDQQMKLLDMITSHGLDPSVILGGLQLGLDASMDDLLAAMTRAMQAIIAAANAELEAGSPSKAFMRVGQSAGLGLIAGWDQTMYAMQAAARQAADSMMVAAQPWQGGYAPAPAPAQTVNTRSLTMPATFNIQNGMDQAAAESWVRRIVVESFR